MGVDFLLISTRLTKTGITEIYPKFIIRNPSEHLMIRGRDFYAVWCENKKLWSTSEQDVIDIIDNELDRYAAENKDRFPAGYRVLHLWDAETGMIDIWHKYCQKQMRDHYQNLDEKLIFTNTEPTRQDYASKRLPYALEPGNTDAWDRLVGTLYSEKERHKIEWAIGSIVSGDSRKLQKFMVFYGDPGSGKGTVLEIINRMFEGYTATFDAKTLGNSSNSFALEAFKSNPLVAIQFDGDLSKIEDNSRLNSLVSHELMTVNEKFKGLYSSRFKCFIFMGTNKPVKITDAKSGLLRRLIDVTPSGNKIPRREYEKLTNPDHGQVYFELGAIAQKCMDIYKKNPGYYDDYVPINMLGASNDFYNFVMDSWPIFHRENQTTLKGAWILYKNYCEDAKVSYPYSQRAFKEELKNYFREYVERETLDDGTRVRSIYRGFRHEKFEPEKDDDKADDKDGIDGWIALTKQASLLDILLCERPAQYENADGSLTNKWINVKTVLADLDTSRVHYVQVPENHIVIDFDIPDENGNKCLEKNLEAANRMPPTYCEVSKSGQGLHLHYMYTGNPKELSRLYGEHIEIKRVADTGTLLPLRRKLTLCNDIPIATLSSGLPKKEVKKTVTERQIKSEKSLREQIAKNLAKEVHAGTKPSMDFIQKILDDAYESDLSYDVSDMRNAIVGFASRSTHHADYCMKLVGKLHFKSKDQEQEVYTRAREYDIPESMDDRSFAPYDQRPIAFYDIEVFPNLLLVAWMLDEDDAEVKYIYNPSPAWVEEFLTMYRLIDFNGRRYDRHVLWGRVQGYSTQQCYNLSQRIVSSKKSDQGVFFGEAYNAGYTDIYDFANAGNKKSLKKLEIEMGIHHLELGLPWDKPVDEKLWPTVAEYCKNDVQATRAAFYYLKADWTARQILADLAGMTVNDTTNSLTTRIIFDRVRRPQGEFQYRNLALPVKELRDEVRKFLEDACPDMMSTLHGDEDSLLPYFPGYYYGPNPDPNQKGMVSLYHEEEVGEGGYVYAEPGFHRHVALLDVASMHPHSIIAECLFGPRFTRRFKEIVDGRVDIKHEAWDEVDKILDGKLSPYIERVKRGEMTSKDLANGLKTAINSVYGLTVTAYENAFRDPRNKDNIVAKRGALFMIDLKKEVQKRGFIVAHIKTDSIKIPEADNDIIQFVMNFGKRYGYTFEHEATYNRMCLVNDAVYIARYETAEECEKRYGYSPGDNKKHGGEWTATGKQFAVPYVFKSLFSHEPIVFDDMCETFSVSGALYLDMNEQLPNVEDDERILMKTLKNAGMSWADYQDFLADPKSKNLDIPLERELRDLTELIAKGHDYRFVGRVGEFTPIIPGGGGGQLMREADGKYSAATGTKGFRWMESGMVRTLGYEDRIDRKYYRKLVDEAAAAIAEHGDLDWFLSENMNDSDIYILN